MKENRVQENGVGSNLGTQIREIFEWKSEELLGVGRWWAWKNI